MDATTGLLTLHDYALTADTDDLPTELVRGVLVREPRPGALHGRIQVRLAYHLERWAMEHPGVQVTTESGYILSDEPATVRGPDLAVNVRTSDPTNQPGGWIRGAPDVAVEVLSPSDTSSAVQSKTLDYLEAGSAAVWIVDPGAATVTVFRPDGTATLLRKGEVLSGESVLPGFELELDELFDS